MLAFEDHFHQAGRWHRRQFLRAGALALGGLTLSDWFAVRAAAAGRKLPLKDRSVKDLLATVMHTLLDIGEVRLMPGIPPRVVEAMTRGEPIRGLV